MPRADFQVVIGLEVHAQLLTRAKLFSSASTRFGEEPNTQTTAVCLGLPGALPVPNARVVELAVRAGLALGCTVNARSEWSRKHYFYPDLPRGYQITQFEFPLCEWGRVDLEEPGRSVRIRRIHLEEDAGKSVHDAADGLTLIDLNRAGTPLVEIVSEPDLRSADEAVEYLKALREILVAIGVNDGNLEEGSFRCDANVSVRPHGATELGTRCELKNLNSFRFIRQAIEVEAARQVELLESGAAVVQETRLFDPARAETRPLRSKEDAHDYRYFPEPDLPPLEVTAAQLEEAARSLPELPRARRRRYVEVLGLPAHDAGVLTQDPDLARLYEGCLSAGGEPRRLSTWFLGELSRLLNASGTPPAQVRFQPRQLVALLAQVDAGTLTVAAARQVFAVVFETGRDPAQVAGELGLASRQDPGAVELAIDQVLAAHPRNVEGYRAGNPKLLGFFVGQVMKVLGGRGDARAVSERLLERLRAP